MQSKAKVVCIIDTNILAYWIAASVLRDININEKILKVYTARYKDPLDLMNTILHTQGLRREYEFFFFEFSLLELRNALKEEILSVFLFEKGVPLSKWGRSLQDDRLMKDLRETVPIDYLLERMNIYLDVFSRPSSNLTLLGDIHPSSRKKYFDVFDELVFQTPKMNTQDLYLLTNSILHGADYFITTDASLKKYNSFTQRKYSLSIIHPPEMLSLLLKRRGKSKN